MTSVGQNTKITEKTTRDKRQTLQDKKREIKLGPGKLYQREQSTRGPDTAAPGNLTPPNLTHYPWTYK